MLRPAKMAEARIVVPTDRKEIAVRALHEMGCLQITSVRDELIGAYELERETPSDLLKECTSLSMRASRLLETCGKVTARSQSRLQNVKGVIDQFFRAKVPRKKRLQARTSREAVRIARRIVTEAERKILPLERRFNKLEERRNEIRRSIRGLELLGRFEFDLKALRKSEYVFADAGTIPSENFEPLLESLEKAVGDEYALVSSDAGDEEKVVAIWCLREHEEKVSHILHLGGFESFELPEMRGTARENLPKVARKLREVERKRRRCFRELRSLCKKHERNLLAVRELLDIERERMDAARNFSRTEKTTIIQGWIPKDEVTRMKRGISRATGGLVHVEISNPGNPDETPPVLLRNPPVVRSFEFLTRMFGFPGKGEIDPTLLIAPVFVFFFSLMLTDAAYGVMSLILSVALLRGVGKVNKGIRDISIVLLCGSVATIAVGILTGGYFGNLLDEYIKITPPRLLNPVKEPEVLLKLSIFVGIAHVTLGLLIGLVQNLKLGEYRRAVTEQLVWLLLIPAGIILVSHYLWGIFPDAAVLPAWFLAGISLAILLVSRGPLGIMNVFSMLGNILSYSRIMALALVTGVLALSVNIICNIISDLPVVGLVLASMVFVFGQLGSFAVNFLSSFVHALRLHYVEFFGKFYQGSGKGFKPFAVRRIYTR
ncbi:MAG: V-type ATP synthase subunit I [Hadesarchaea archaeon]|nr:V-type ATP synthase subunit I [Hadesarchaea archaeon]